MEVITFEDRLRHVASGDPTWQESFYLGWLDLQQNVAGAHHLSLAPDGSTHVWSWLLVDGKVVKRSQQHDLILPSHELQSISAGSLELIPGEGLKQLALNASFEDAQANLEFDATAVPVVVDFNQEDTILADRHYEMTGAVSGEVRIGARSITLDAIGWHDHSWGRREFKSNPSHRWFFAVFGDDLSFSVFSFVTGTRRASFGWVHDAGVTRPIAKVAFHAIVNDDGMTPEGCDAEIFTQGHRGYRVKGVCQSHALMGGNGWFGVDGMTKFECGGRIGQGFLEVAELKAMNAEMARELGV